MNIIIPHGFEPNYTVGFVKGLYANKVDFSAISSDKTHQQLLQCNIKSINLRGSQSQNRHPITKLINLVRYYIQLILYLLKNKGATIHFTSSMLIFDAFFLNLYFRSISSKYICTVHNLLPHNKEKSNFCRIIYKYIYKIPNILIVHTELMKKELIKKFGIGENKIKVMSIGLNEQIPTAGVTKNDARARLAFNKTDNLILFFGYIDKYKGIDLIIQAMDILNIPSLKLVIAGQFKNIVYRRKLISMINSSRNKDKIYLFNRHILNDEVEVFFKSCDVLVLPYRELSQSGVLFLALRFGIPIIATNVGSLREFVDKDIGIITKTNNVDGLADAITYFFNNRNEFKNEKGIHKYKKYKWENASKTILSVYE